MGTLPEKWETGPFENCVVLIWECRLKYQKMFFSFFYLGRMETIRHQSFPVYLEKWRIGRNWDVSRNGDLTIKTLGSYLGRMLICSSEIGMKHRNLWVSLGYIWRFHRIHGEFQHQQNRNFSDDLKPSSFGPFIVDWPIKDRDFP